MFNSLALERRVSTSITGRMKCRQPKDGRLHAAYHWQSDQRQEDDLGCAWWHYDSLRHLEGKLRSASLKMLPHGEGSASWRVQEGYKGSFLGEYRLKHIAAVMLGLALSLRVYLSTQEGVFVPWFFGG